MVTQYEIGLIGGGNAAEAIVAGLLRRSILLDDRIIISDPSDARRRYLTHRFNVTTTDDNRKVVANSYLVILAVKPQIHREVIAGVADLVRDDHVIVSIMAGVNTKTLESQFPSVRARVVRVMPNLPMLLGEGMAAVVRGTHCDDDDLMHARRIFEAGGQAVVLEDESLMDAVTAVSGSGPAYFYYFVDALVAAGQEAGLSHEQAVRLAKQTCLGAARMLMETDDAPSVLYRKVMSPGGTTEAAFNDLKANGVFEHLKSAVLAAHRRSKELGH